MSSSTTTTTTTTEESSAIDDKKNEDSGGKKTPDFKGFIKDYLFSLVVSIGIFVFVIGSIGLYTSKVAQANILPDNIEFAPYTVIDRIVNDLPIDINVMRPSLFSDNKDTLSQKAVFQSREYVDSFNGSFLCSLKKAADPEKGETFANAALFFSTVYDNVVAKNFLAINSLFFYLSFLPESMIMLVYGLFGIFLWILLYFFNVCISLFYHLVSIPELFRTLADDNTGEKKWEAAENTSLLRFGKLLLFFFVWIPTGFLSVFVTPAFFTVYALVAPMYATYRLPKQQKQFTFVDFLTNTFVYKKFFFLVLATLSLFSNGSKYLGNNGLIGIAIAVAFAYFMGLYANPMPSAETGTGDGFTSKIRQNMKQATVSANTEKPVLVKVCQQNIPMVDAKRDKIIGKGTFRPRTKPSNTGGDGEADATKADATEDIVAPEANATTPIMPPASDPYSMEAQLPLVPPAVEALTPPTQEAATAAAVEAPRQLGGRNRKKYNIQWT